MFVPRRQLIKAKTSALCELPVRKASSELSLSASALSDHVANDDAQELEALSRSKSSGAAVQSILEDFTKSSKHKPSSSESIGSDLEPAEQSDLPDKESSGLSSVDDISRLINKNLSREKVDFSLGLWRVGDNLQVIDSRSRGDALPTETLLRNILRIHGCTSSTVQAPAQEIINWPLGNHHSDGDSFDAEDDQSWSAAHEMLMSFLEGRLLSKPVKMFWLMGEDALKAVVGESVQFNDCAFKSISIDAFAAEALVLPSLRECLNFPLNKKTLWTAINSFLIQYDLPPVEKD